MRLPVVSIRMTLAAACAAILLPAAADAACSPDTFGAQKRAVCGSEKCPFFTPPAEIAAIARGLFSERIGLFINDGYAGWVGVDLDKGEIVDVQRFAGSKLGEAPRANALDPKAVRRETKEDGRHWIDILRRAPLVSAAAGDIVCGANTVWAEQAGIVLRPVITDMHSGVVLIDRETRKAVGGPGGMSEAADALHAQLQRLVRGAPAVIVPKR
jgi:hypothetical protein